MAITEDGAYIRIAYVDGDPKGDSAANPYTLDDIYDADVAGGWGFVTKSGYDFIIDGRCLRNSFDTYVLFSYNTLTLKNSPNGCSLYFRSGYLTSNYSTIHCASHKTIILGVGSTINTGFLSGAGMNLFGTLNGCSLGYFQYITVYGTGVMNDIMYYYARYGIVPYSSFTNNNVKVLNASNSCIYTWNMLYDTTLNNFKNDSGRGIYYGLFRPSTLTLIDCEVDPAIYTISTSWNGEQWANHQTTFTWKVGDGISIILKDKDDNIILNKNVDNDDTDIVTFVNLHITKVAGETGSADVTNFYPFTLTLSKKGYQDLTISDINITRGQPTVIRGEMVPSGTVISGNNIFYDSTIY